MIYDIDTAMDILVTDFEQQFDKVTDDYNTVYSDMDDTSYPVAQLSQGLWETLVSILKDVVDSVKADGTMPSEDKLTEAYELLLERTNYIKMSVGTLNDVITDINDADDLIIEFADANGINYAPPN